MAFIPRAWQAIDRRRAGYRRSYRKIFRRALNAQIKPVMSQIQNINPNNTLITDVVIYNTEVEKAYKSIYNVVGLDFARFHREQSLKQDDFWDSEYMRHIQELVESGAIGSQISAIGDTSKEHLQKILNELIPEIQAQGLSTSQAQTMLRDRLKSIWHRDMRFRTERIVRTEATRASNFGSVEGIKSTNIDMWKIWVATPDINTRDAHIMANGQKVDINEPFNVDGEQLMYPGDASQGASAANVINCRCAVTFEPKNLET